MRPENEIEKIKRSYFRENLLELIGNTDNKPIVIRGRYKHREDGHFYTFISIRPIIPGYKASNICGHINVPISEVNEYTTLNAEDERKPFIIIGVPSYYGENIKRGCVKLYREKGVTPIFRAEEIESYLSKELFETMYKFDMKYVLAERPQSYPSLQ